MAPPKKPLSELYGPTLVYAARRIGAGKSDEESMDALAELVGVETDTMRGRYRKGALPAAWLVAIEDHLGERLSDWHRSPFIRERHRRPRARRARPAPDDADQAA